MTTPEGRVKANIKKVLDKYKVYYFMPVQNGMGATGVDFHCVVKVTYIMDNIPIHLPIAFFIEAKRPGEHATGRQLVFLNERRDQQYCKTFTIDDDPSIERGAGNIKHLENWLQAIEDSNEYARTRHLGKDNLSISA